MASSPPDRRSPRKKPMVDRRAPPGAPGSLQWVKSILGRPLGVERRGLGVHVVLVDRRRNPSPHQPPTLPQVCSELRARMLAHGDERATQVMRHLVHVHDELGRQGWPAVEALPARVLGLALVQAEMLASEGTSRPLAHLVDRLRVLRVAAELREERQVRSREIGTGTTVDVSESTPEAFEEIERSWVGTVPPASSRRDTDC